MTSNIIKVDFIFYLEKKFLFFFFFFIINYYLLLFMFSWNAKVINYLQPFLNK